MIIKSFPDRILLPDKRDVLRAHLYIKLLQYGIQPIEKDMGILLELYWYGGYNNSDEQEKFFDICLQKGFRKAKQAVRNTLSKYISLGVLDKPKNTVLHVNEKYIPNVKFDQLVLQHAVTHAN